MRLGYAVAVKRDMKESGVKRKRFKKVYVEITNVCNLACSFCPKTARQPAFLPTARFTDILNQITPFTDYIYLHVKGEPFLHPDLARLLEIAGEMGVWVNLTTNGTLIGKAGPSLLGKPALRQVNFSLHSIVDSCAEAGLPPAETAERQAEYMRAILDFVQAARSREHMNVIISLRLWNLKHASQPANRHLLEMIESAFALPFRIEEVDIPARGIRIAEQVYLNQDYQFHWPDLESEDGDAAAFCYGLKDQAAILVDGTVVPCCLDGEGVIALGNIYQTNFAEIINSDRALRIREGFSQRRAVEDLCKKCEYRTRFD